MITEEDIKKLKSFIERGEMTEIAKIAKVSNATVTNFFKAELENITTDVQIRIIDASVLVIDKKNQLQELAKEKISNL